MAGGSGAPPEAPMADVSRRAAAAVVHRDARGGRLRAARPRGRDVDGRPAAHRHLVVRLRRPGLRVLLPALGEQRGAVAPEGRDGADRVRARRSSRSRVASAFLVAFGVPALPAGARPRLGGRRAGRRCSARSCVVGLQIWQLTQLPFFPGSSGYASCFIGWASLNIALVLCGHLLAGDVARARARGSAARRRRTAGRRRSSLPNARMLARERSRAARTSGGSSRSSRTFFWVLFYVL